jgi:hypothetical protein
LSSLNGQCKPFFETPAPCQLKEDEKEMSEEKDKHHLAELKEMILEKKPKESVEKVLVKFCERHGVSIDTCRVYYNRLLEKGEVTEK